MTSYERVKAALEHREGGRVPFDLGGSVLTGINRHAYVALRRYLGLPEVELKLVDQMQQLARVNEDLLARLEVDIACVDPEAPAGPTLARAAVRDGEYWRMVDEWGIAWKMPVDGGYYFDMADQPLKAAEIAADLERFPWPNPTESARFATLKKRADSAVAQGKAYILGRQYAGIWETALWMCGF
ncbi:MAG: hypothetical protein Q8M76_04855, partial [Spirochaetaceae bacterium]|nr:hypothetical protein [Spirochaetaceae bacterium]